MSEPFPFSIRFDLSGGVAKAHLGDSARWPRLDASSVGPELVASPTHPPEGDVLVAHERRGAARGYLQDQLLGRAGVRALRRGLAGGSVRASWRERARAAHGSAGRRQRVTPWLAQEGQRRSRRGIARASPPVRLVTHGRSSDAG